MCLALALVMGAGHLGIGILASIPFLARMTHLLVPSLVRQHGSWSVARGAFWLERTGFLAAAVVGVTRPEGWAIPLFLAAFAAAMLGQALYDAAMAALHSEVAAPGHFGEYTSVKTRWASISGLALGIAASIGVDSTEHLGIPAHIARALAITVGVAVHCLIARPFARMGVMARAHLRRVVGPSTGQGALRALAPRTPEEWAVVHLALAWGFAYGIGARQSEAMAMRSLGVSVGTIALLNAALLGAGILGARTWGRLGDRFGGKGLMALAMVAFAIDPLWSILALYVHPAALVPSYLIWGVFNTGWSIAQTVALVRTTGDPADRIRLLTIYNVAYGIAAGVAPLLGGALLTWLDGPLPTRAAFATLFAVALLLRVATIPVLRRMPSANAASARHVSSVYLRAVMSQTLRRTRAVGSALRLI
jgi:MFS transporter